MEHLEVLHWPQLSRRHQAGTNYGHLCTAVVLKRQCMVLRHQCMVLRHQCMVVKHQCMMEVLSFRYLASCLTLNSYFLFVGISKLLQDGHHIMVLLLLLMMVAGHQFIHLHGMQVLLIHLIAMKYIMMNLIHHIMCPHLVQ